MKEDQIVERFLVVVFLILVIFVGANEGKGKISEPRDEGITINVDKQPLGLVFRELMSKHNLNIGFEQSTRDQGKNYFDFDTNMPLEGIFSRQSPDASVSVQVSVRHNFNAGSYPVSLNLVNASIEDVFNAIVPQMKNYGWEMRDGVINIFPVSERDKRLAALLDLKIRHFQLREGSMVADIIPALLDLPEFQQFRRINRITFSPIREGSETLIGMQYGRRIDGAMQFENITFRDLLNRITRIKRGGWILKIQGKTNEGGVLGDLDI